MQGDSFYKIGEFHNHNPEIKPYDPAYVLVAADVSDIICQRLPYLQVEHIGSSAVSGMAGKRIIDLLVTYPSGQLDATCQALKAMGFQTVFRPDPFVGNRPNYTGSINYMGTIYDLSLYVVDEKDPLVYELKGFRDRLRYDITLQTAYLDRKRTILKSGGSDPQRYAEAKAEFIRSAMNKI